MTRTWRVSYYAVLPLLLLLQVHDSRVMVKLSRLPFQTVKGLFSAPESSAFSVPEAIGCKPESHWLQARKPALSCERLGACAVRMELLLISLKLQSVH